MTPRALTSILRAEFFFGSTGVIGVTGGGVTVIPSQVMVEFMVNPDWQTSQRLGLVIDCIKHPLILLKE